MRIFKDQVANAACLFIIIFTLCLILSICLKSFFKSEINVSFVKDIFSIGATLFVGLLGIALYSDWRDEKTYDLEKSQAENLINRINTVHTKIYEKYYLLRILEHIQEKFIAINGLKYKFDLSSELNLITLDFENLNRILDTKIENSRIQNFILNIELFRLAIQKIEKEYQTYYDLLNQDLKNSEDTIIKTINFHKYPVNSPFITPAAFRVDRINNIYRLITSEDIKIEMPNNLTKEPQTWEQQYNCYKSIYDKSFDNLMFDLVKIIKPHKKTA